MKKSLIVICAACALVVGCDQKNQGTADSDRNQNTGFGSSRDTTLPSSGTMSRDTNTVGSGSSSSITNTSPNSSVGAPGTSSGQSSGTAPKN